MDQTTLVTTDIAIGSKVLELLDRSNAQISLAMWLRLPEYDDWRLALSSKSLDGEEPARAYGRVHEVLDKAGISFQQTPTLMILKMSDPFLRALRKTFRKTKTVEGMRLGGQMIGGRFVDDAIVYRIQ